MNYLVLLGFFLALAAPAQDNQPLSLEQVFNQAMKHMDAGAYQQAEEEFRQILRRQPANPSALINLGVLYSRTHRFTEAIDTYKEALRGAPGQQVVQLNLSLAYLKQESYADALPYFTRLHLAHPDDDRITTLLATCLAYTGKPEEAITLLLPLTGPDSQNRGALYLLGVAYTRANQPKQAHETYAKLFASASGAQTSFLYGEAYLDATDYPGAVQAFQEALAANSNLPGAHREMGRAYLGMHHNDQAETELRRALVADPHDTGALYSLGALLVQLSRWSEARAFLEQAQNASPDSWATAYYLGKANFELRDMASAEKLLRRAAELNPDDPGAPYLLARILREQGRKEEADTLMRRVAALHATALDAEKRAMQSADKEKSAAMDQPIDPNRPK